MNVLQERRFFRGLSVDDPLREELTEQRYREIAEGNVYDVDLAVIDGFRTCFAVYWSETRRRPPSILEVAS
jgi:hypothetical protein